MIIGIGCDIVEIARIEDVIKRQGQAFLERIFTAEERDYCFSRQNPYPSLAVRFAAKEAASKALGCGIGSLLGWKDCAVSNNEQGKPYLHWNSSVESHFGPFSSHLTLSHTATHALAFVVIESVKVI